MHGYRKTLVAVLGVVLGFILALLGKLTADFATLVAVCVGSYNAAHMVQDRYQQPPAVPAPPGGPSASDA